MQCRAPVLSKSVATYDALKYCTSEHGFAPRCYASSARYLLLFLILLLFVLFILLYHYCIRLSLILLLFAPLLCVLVVDTILIVLLLVLLPLVPCLSGSQVEHLLTGLNVNNMHVCVFTHPSLPPLLLFWARPNCLIGVPRECRL